MSSKLSNFYVRSSIFTILSAAAALLNYLLYPAISHLLNTASFGSFTVLNTASTQILGILLAFNLTSIYIVKTFSEKEARSYAQALQRLLVWIFLGASIFFLALSPIISTKLKIDGLVPFLIVTFILLSSVPGVIWTGYLQGHKQLINVGVFNFTSSLAKLFFAIILSSMFGAIGGLTGVLLGILSGLVILRFSTRRKLPSLISIFHRPTAPQALFLRASKFYIGGTVALVGGLSLLQNLDITYAKYLFSPDVAGAYSGVSILSNALYYLFFILIWVIIPEIDPAQPFHNRRLLRNTYGIVISLGGIALLVVYLLQKFIVRLLMGDNFTQFSYLLSWAVLYQIGLVAITFYAYYLLILRNHHSLMLGLLTVIPCLVSPFLFAHDPRSLIVSLNISLFAGFGIYLLIALLLDKRRKYA